MKIPLTKLTPHPLNRHFDRIGEKWKAMVESVREHGVIQMPLVRKHEGGYQMVCGHRRAAAAEEAGLESIDCDVRVMDDRTVLELLVIENLERENPDPVEEGKLLRALVAEGVDVNVLAHRLKRSVEWITTRQRLLDLGEEVLEAVRRPKEDGGHLDMGTVGVILSVSEADRQRAIQLVLHPEWTTEVLGKREAESVIKTVILEPARKKAAWEKESPGLVKAWKKALGTYLTKDQKKDLVVQPIRWAEIETCKMKTPAEDLIPRERLADPTKADELRWVHLAILHGVPVWVIPGTGTTEAEQAVAVVDERLLVLVEEAAAEPLYEMRGGEKVLIREHAGTPVLLTDKQAKGKTGKDKRQQEEEEKREERIAKAVEEMDGGSPVDPAYQEEAPVEPVITQHMESRAWVDLGPVRELKANYEAGGEWKPEWARAMDSGGLTHLIPEVCEWVEGLKK
jgi:ParB family transcriptional regulator, chromosome partitioning protein